MNATSATLIFAAAFAAMGLAAGAYGASIAHTLLSLALILPVGAFAFWFGARRVRHEWYSALISGVVAFAVTLATLRVLSPVPSIWLLLLAINVAMAALGFFLGCTPLFPKVRRQQQQPDNIFVAVACVCALIILFVGVVGVMSLQRLLPPADTVLSGPTGVLMFFTPTILVGLLASFRVAWTLTKRIRRGLRMPDKDPLPVAFWAELKINWRLVAGIAVVILMLIAAKGFGSYFYVTESGVSVRAPLQFSMRHYEWNDVITVSVECQNQRVRPTHRFRYVLEMSDGQEVDLSYALFSVSPKFRAAAAVRFAEFIPSHLNTVPSIRYEFDVSQDALVTLGENRGVALSNALSEQVLTHGGTLQR